MTQCISEGWLERYGYAPVLLEIFVTAPWSGTYYREANWIHVGQTAGTGRQERKDQETVPVREVFMYPLRPDWLEVLTRETVTPLGTSHSEKMNQNNLDDYYTSQF